MVRHPLMAVVRSEVASDPASGLVSANEGDDLAGGVKWQPQACCLACRPSDALRADAHCGADD